ncbi:MAG: DNA mismatch repair protein MutS [Deltaproteobacteria bacterium]|nr:DNA mismatch repair protein MutS [Deltaproteobacteria bacterium]
MSKLTPMMQQYLQIKKNYRDVILFYRMGDFYEMFFEDALVASKILGLALTTRDKAKENPVPMCGLPYHSASPYIAKLIREGKKVAVCEQGSASDAVHGLMPREVVQVITPGLIVEDNQLDSQKSNYLMAVYSHCRSSSYGVAFLDISTGDFRVTEVRSHQDFISEVNRISPSEVLTMQPDIVPEGLYVTSMDLPMDERTAKAVVRSHFKTLGVEGLGLQEHAAALVSAGMILEYVKETQKGILAHITGLRYYNPGKYMILGANTKRNLELFESIARNNSDTLFHMINATTTSMGARKLSDWLAFPLMDVIEIDARLDAVGDFVPRVDILNGLRDFLSDIPDMERILGRVSANRASPRDFIALAAGLDQVPRIQKLLFDVTSTMLINLMHQMVFQEHISERIKATIVSEPPAKLSDGNVITVGIDAELDELRSIRSDSRKWIASLEAQEKQRTKIASLKIGYNKVFGYYIEVTKSYADKVPENYIRKQTLINAERFITPELKEYEAKLLGAQEAINQIETRIFSELRAFVIEQIPNLKGTIEALATLDVLGCFAWVALQKSYTRPLITQDRTIELKAARHPVVEQVLKVGEFVPNDCRFDGKRDTLHLITGPNMAGKSTYMRQIALIAIMAQIGCFVPAGKAKLGLVDRIFTRVGALDNLSAGQSTFLVEMSETADILHNATEQSLVILDEIGRGTSTYDGMSLAWAVAEYLDKHKTRTFFATHYHELADLARRHKNIKNFHMAVDDNGHDVVFLRELKRGAIGESYGIHVARLAGIPDDVIANAKNVLSGIRRKGKSVPGIQEVLPVQSSLFESNGNFIIREIMGLDLESMKPIDALNLLYTLKNKIKEEFPQDS